MNEKKWNKRVRKYFTFVQCFHFYLSSYKKVDIQLKLILYTNFNNFHDAEGSIDPFVLQFFHNHCFSLCILLRSWENIGREKSVSSPAQRPTSSPRSFYRRRTAVKNDAATSGFLIYHRCSISNIAVVGVNQKGMLLPSILSLLLLHHVRCIWVLRSYFAILRVSID